MKFITLKKVHGFAINQKREREAFLFFPKTMGNECRWLERAMSELLPCPTGHDSLLVTDDQYHKETATRTYWVQCTTCGWCGPVMNTLQKCITAWNSRAKDKQKWISASERLPKSKVMVMVRIGSEKFIAKYSKNNWWWDESGMPIIEDVTHWSPINWPED